MRKKQLLVILLAAVALAVGCFLPRMKENLPSESAMKSGLLGQNETWSGNILITDYLEVPQGVTLTIKPGTRVMFKHYRHGYTEPQGRIQLVVRGTMKAVGTPENRIWFTSDAGDTINGDWSMIRFIDSGSDDIIKYAIVEFGQQGINIWNSSPTIANTIVRWNNWEGIYLESYSSPIIENCMIYQNGYNGIAMEQFNENVVVRYNLIDRNGQAGIHHMASSSTIEHNVITRNAQGISLMDGSHVSASYNRIANNRSGGIWAERGDSSADLKFNNIENNMFGLGGLEFTSISLNYNNIINSRAEEISLGKATAGTVDAENNWWGTTSESQIRITNPLVEVDYLPLLNQRVVGNPETGEQITLFPAFDYDDLKIPGRSIDYIPGYESERDRFQYVLPDDETRRVIARIPTPNFEYPWSLTWAENCIWMADGGIFKLDPANGDVVAQFSFPGTRPWGMGFDGASLWVNDFTERRVYEIDPQNGTELGSFSYAEHYPGGLNGLAWDGEHLCLTKWGAASALVKFSRSGDFVEEIPVEVGIGGGLTFDGDYFWAPGSGKLYKIDGSGRVIGWISAGSAETTWDLAWDGQYLWSGERTNEDWTDNKIFKLEIIGVS